MRHLVPATRRGIAVACTLVLAAIAHATPVLFCTQTPDYADFTTIASVFGNQKGGADSAPRGGDLYIRYDDGTLRNLTQECGYGTAVHQDITVREPAVHWNGTKALFSMVIGGTTQNDYTPVYFQIYEVTGLGQGQPASITKLPQPGSFNNVAPIYGTDDRIIFASDRPRDGDRRLYPQLDEYEVAPTVSGIWSMKPDGTDLRLLDHSPSGDFRPSIDSYGRLLFTRWDHLQRDQEADYDIDNIINNEPLTYGTVTWPSEASDTFHSLQPGDEVFPEAREFHPDGASTPHPVWDADHQSDELGHRFNQFVPWASNEDGTDLETLNHIGRHELFGYIPGARTGLPDFNGTGSFQQIYSFLNFREDPTHPGRFIGIDCPEFSTHAGGQLVYIDAPPGRNAAIMGAQYLSYSETRTYVDEGGTPGPHDIGRFRDPMPKTDGTLWASYSTSPFIDRPTVSDPGYPAPYTLSSRYDFHITRLEQGGDGWWVPTTRLIPGGISKNVSYWENNSYRNISYSGPLWELYPVEVASRTRPTSHATPIPQIEKDILDAELGGDTGIANLQAYLRANNLALVVSRDVTRRADKQQDYNLKVAWSSHQSAEPGSTPKEIAWMQFLEGQQRRGFFNGDRDGRRVIASEAPLANNPAQPGAPTGAVRLGDDGSMAAFVPARRALTWQTTKLDGTPAVRERYWLTFQPGEIRTCTNCHGVNQVDVLGNPAPTNPPQALTDLLEWWKASRAGNGTGWVVR